MAARTALDGTWDVVVATPVGDQDLRLELHVTGEELTGTARHAAGSYPFRGGTVKADGSATVRIRVTTPVTANLTITLRASGDELAGSARAMLLPPFPVRGVRVG